MTVTQKYENVHEYIKLTFFILDVTPEKNPKYNQSKNNNKNNSKNNSYNLPWFWNRRENIGVGQTVTARQDQTAGLNSELSDVSMDITSCFLLLVSTAHRLVLVLLSAVKMMFDFCLV